MSTEVTGRRRRSSRSKKAKGEPRVSNSTVVIGPLDSKEAFDEIVETVKSTCGEVRSLFYRDYQRCGFVYFHDETTTQKTIDQLNGTTFHGNPIRVLPPLQYFPDERDAAPRPPPKPEPEAVVLPTINEDHPTSLPETHTAVTPPSRKRSSLIPIENLSQLPTHTLVMKNINFGLRQEKLLELLREKGAAPDCVNYLFDHAGKFRGTAFVHYPSLQASEEALNKLNGIDIGGRELRIEFKRKPGAVDGTDTAHYTQASRRSLPVNSTRGSVAHVFGLGNGTSMAEEFDPANMDLEQQAIMTELQNFIANRHATEWNFPMSMTQAQRNMIREIASYLGLYHVSTGERGARYVVVSKNPFNVAPTAGGQARQRTRFMSHGEASSHLRSRVPAAAPVRAHQHPLREAATPTGFRTPAGPDGTKGFHKSQGRGRGKARMFHSLISPSEFSALQVPTQPFNLANRSDSSPVVVREGEEFGSM